VLTRRLGTPRPPALGARGTPEHAFPRNGAGGPIILAAERAARELHGDEGGGIEPDE